jgi:hypothetical protein
MRVYVHSSTWPCRFHRVTSGNVRNSSSRSVTFHTFWWSKLVEFFVLFLFLYLLPVSSAWTRRALYSYDQYQIEEFDKLVIWRHAGPGYVSFKVRIGELSLPDFSGPPPTGQKWLKFEWQRFTQRTRTQPKFWTIQWPGRRGAPMLLLTSCRNIRNEQ